MLISHLEKTFDFAYLSRGRWSKERKGLSAPSIYVLKCLEKIEQ